MSDTHNMSNLSTDHWDHVNDWYYISGSILSILLIISELLAWWPSCRANAITQLYKCVDCISINIERPIQEEVSVHL
jgi:hypothetical protein